MSLRIEVFVDDLDDLDDLDVFVDFYARVLAFELADDRLDTEWPFVAVAVAGACDGVRIGAVRAWKAVDQTVRTVPTGAEIVLARGAAAVR
jgi:hypothetical protein